MFFELAELFWLPYCGGRPSCYSDGLYDFLSSFLDVIRMSMSRDMSRLFGRPVRLFGHPNWYTDNTFQVLLFQFHFNKKIVEVVINDFKVYVIILKWLRGPKCRQGKTVRQKDIKAKERIIYKSLFIYLKRNRSWRRSLFLLDFFMNLL